MVRKATPPAATRTVRTQAGKLRSVKTGVGRTVAAEERAEVAKAAVKATPARPAKATPAKATPAKATPAKATPAKAAPAKRGGPRITKIEYTIPAGYIVRWPHASFDTLKKTDASADGPTWLVVCTQHGKTAPAASAKDGDLLGSAAQRPSWCPGCKTGAKA